MGILTFGHQGVIRFVEETTAGTTPANPALLLFSKEMARVRLFKDATKKESLDIGEIEVDEFFNPQFAYGVEVEFHIYDVARYLDFWERKSTGEPRSYTLELIPNEDATTKTYFRGTGWRAKTVRLTGRVGDAWVGSVVFEGGKWAVPVTVDPGIGTGSREAKAAIVEALKHFASGAIQLNAATWAILLDEFEATIEHGTEAKYTTGDKDPVVTAATHGKRKISGTANFSLDDGFKEHWDRVTAFADHSIVVPFGGAGAKKITFSNVKFPRIDAELGAEQDVLMGGQPWQALTYAEGTV